MGGVNASARQERDAQAGKVGPASSERRRKSRVQRPDYRQHYASELPRRVASGEPDSHYEKDRRDDGSPAATSIITVRISYPISNTSNHRFNPKTPSAASSIKPDDQISRWEEMKAGPRPLGG